MGPLLGCDSPTFKKVNSMSDFSLTASEDKSSKAYASSMNDVASVFENETFIDRIAPSLLASLLQLHRSTYNWILLNWI